MREAFPAALEAASRAPGSAYGGRSVWEFIERDCVMAFEYEGGCLSVRHLLGCTVVTLTTDVERSRLILRGIYKTPAEVETAVDGGAEVRAVVRVNLLSA